MFREHYLLIMSSAEHRTVLIYKYGTLLQYSCLENPMDGGA